MPALHFDKASDASLEIRGASVTLRFTLYEDDGETQAWRQGAHAETSIACTECADEIVLVIEPPAGDPAIVPAGRRWRLRIRVPSPPTGVTASRSLKPDWRMEGSWVVLEPIAGPAEVRLRW
jgi:Domain of unknown function (DUF5110)